MTNVFPSTWRTKSWIKPSSSSIGCEVSSWEPTDSSRHIIKCIMCLSIVMISLVPIKTHVIESKIRQSKTIKFRGPYMHLITHEILAILLLWQYFHRRKCIWVPTYATNLQAGQEVGDKAKLSFLDACKSRLQPRSLFLDLHRHTNMFHCSLCWTRRTNGDDASNKWNPLNGFTECSIFGNV